MRREQWRRWRRGMAIFCAGLAGTYLTASLAARAYGRARVRAAESALAERGGSLDLASYELVKMTPAENAAIWLEAGASAVVWDWRETHAGSLFESASVPWTSWDASRTEAVREALRQNDGALTTLHRAAALSRSSFGIEYRDGAAANLPDLLELRRATVLLRAEARLAAREQDRERFLTAIRTVRRCADSLSAEPVLIVLLMGMVIEGELLELAAEVATSSESWMADPSFLRALHAELPRTNRESELRRALAAESAEGVEALRRGRLPGLMDGSPPWPVTALVEPMLSFPVAELTKAAVVERTLQVLERVETPLGVVPDPAFVTPSVFLIHRRLAFLAAPPGLQVAREVQDRMALRQLVATALRMRILALEGSGYPEPEALPASLREANPLTGLPLEYALQADGSVRLAVPGIQNEALKNRSTRRPLVLPAVARPRQRKIHAPAPARSSTVAPALA
jgi:hypothetical protein